MFCLGTNNRILRQLRSFFSRRWAAHGCLLWVACLGTLHAETFDYFADHTLASTTVDITAISTHPARLADIFALVESQTNFAFIYLPKQIPLNDRIAIESGKSITLARLFYSISNLTGVVFTRHDLRVTVRRSRKDDRIATQSPQQNLPVKSPVGFAFGNLPTAVRQEPNTSTAL